MTNETVIAILSRLKDCYLGIVVNALDLAIEAVKSQKPRIMTLYEVAKMAADYQDSMLWFEPKELDNDMWFMAYAQPVESDETDIHIYEFGNEQPIEAKKYLYGKTWRCWTARPDQATREATPWN